MFSVYAIYNELRDKIYIGHTSDLKSRLKRHNKILKNKITSFTSKNSGIWKLVYSEEFNTRSGAIKREKELKSQQGRKFIRNLISNKY